MSACREGTEDTDMLSTPGANAHETGEAASHQEHTGHRHRSKRPSSQRMTAAPMRFNMTELHASTPPPATNTACTSSSSTSCSAVPQATDLLDEDGNLLATPPQRTRYKRSLQKLNCCNAPPLPIPQCQYSMVL